MKISSGWSKGLKILAPPGLETRPTRERVRQSALNMIQPWVQNARVLDLYAGTGAVGMEMVSRGASGGDFVESSAGAIKCLKQNLDAMETRAEKNSLQLSPWRVLAGEVQTILTSLPSANYDVVWADPPYEQVQSFIRFSGEQVLRALSAEGIFVLESSSDIISELGDWNKGVALELIKQRKYGVSLISVWKKSR